MQTQSQVTTPAGTGDGNSPIAEDRRGALADIHFKCHVCERQLMVDSAGAGMQLNCPNCDSVLTIPTQYIPHTCPNCLKIVPVDSALRGTRLHCPHCNKAIIPPLLIHQKHVMFMLCHHCEQRIQVSITKMGKNFPCPQCQQLLWGPELQEFANYRVAVAQ